MTSLHNKLKQFNLNRCLLIPNFKDWQWLGRQLDRKFELLDSLLLSVKRGALSEQDIINRLGAFIIVRAVEDDLSLYQDQITYLSQQLEDGAITESQFTDKLTAMTVAILMLMFLLGSGQSDSEQLTELRLSVEDGEYPNIDLSELPTEVNAQLQQAFNIAEESAAKLGAELIEGEFGRDNLTDRLSMWLNTAVGVYGLGQLFGADDNKLMWLRGPTKDSCGDCRTLDRQIHTSLEWRNFYTQTGKRPQGEGLACNGFRCLYSLVETDERVSGNFV